MRLLYLPLTMVEKLPEVGSSSWHQVLY